MWPRSFLEEIKNDQIAYACLRNASVNITELSPEEVLVVVPKPALAPCKVSLKKYLYELRE
jgi:hypothetical protein